MKKSGNKYPDAIITDLASIFAQKDSNAPGYMSGAKLIALFNSLGFADRNKFPGIGIVTSEGSGLSRTQYAIKRLSDLNDAFRLPEALTAFLEFNKGNLALSERINSIFEKYQIHSPIAESLKLIVADVVTGFPVERPKLAEFRQTSLPTVKPIKQPQSNPRQDTGEIKDAYFDSIPVGRKIAFISYSWDDEKHKEWVRQLANDLFANGIFALLDQHLPAGYSLTHFMNTGLNIAHKVIVVGTPQYKEKSIKSLSGGAVYEESIIHTELMDNIATTKFLPIVRVGTFSSSLPPLLSKRIGFDFSDDAKYPTLISEIVREIFDVPKHPIPTLGEIPTFDYGDLSPREIANLKKPESDFRKKQDRKWLDRLLGVFSFQLMHNYLTDYPTWVDERIFISIDIWNAIIGNPAFNIYDPTLSKLIADFHALWHQVELIGLNYYTSEPNTGKARFHGLCHDNFVSKEAEAAYSKIINLQTEMQPILKKLASYIQINFEIDVEETSAAFLESLKR